MHTDGWFPWFGLGHWGFGLLIWLFIVIVFIMLFKSVFSNKDK